MTRPKGISKKLPNPSLDFKRLRQEGIELIQSLSGDEWTDYNLHDPGVTTLEVLCYGLTDLGYRSSLLYDAFQQEGLTQSDFVENYFLKPEEILNGLPTTKWDYEDFIQKNHSQVLQAWFVEYPVFSSGVMVEGGYEIALLLRHDARYENLNTDVIRLPLDEANIVLEAIIFDQNNKRFVWKDIQTIVDCKLDQEDTDNFIVFETYNSQVSLVMEVIYQNRTQSDLIHTKARVSLSDGLKTRKKSFTIESHKSDIVRKLESRGFLNGIIYTLEKEKYKADILTAVKRTLLPVRNLCEDFISLRVVNPQELKLEAEIILDDYAPHATVMVHHIYDHLDSFLLRYLFESKHGRDKQRILYGSNLVEEMVKIEGIVAARILSLNLFIDGVPTISLKGATSFECIYLQQFSYYVPIISREKSDIKFIPSDVFEKPGEKNPIRERDLPGPFDIADIDEEKMDSEKEGIKPIDKTFFESLQQYYSIQKDFPENYRLNENLLHGRTPETLKVRNRQFKAYLLFFERILIDYLHKLYHFNDLLSLKKRSGSPGKELERLKMQFPEIDDLKLINEEMWNNTISSATDTTTQLMRKHKILDHLLARFATTTPPMVQGINDAENLQRFLEAKTSLLQNISIVTRERGLGISIRPDQNIWNSDLLSGFQKRIYRLFGLSHEFLQHLQLSKVKGNKPCGFYLVEHILLVKKDEGNIMNKKFNNAADLLYDYIVNMSKQYKQHPAYSFQVSIVLPSWYPDWRNQKTRIESIIREELPAHILPYFHWLHKKNMGEFESCYEDWLKALLLINS